MEYFCHILSQNSLQNNKINKRGGFFFFLIYYQIVCFYTQTRNHINLEQILPNASTCQNFQLMLALPNFVSMKLWIQVEI